MITDKVVEIVSTVIHDNYENNPEFKKWVSFTFKEKSRSKDLLLKELFTYISESELDDFIWFDLEHMLLEVVKDIPLNHLVGLSKVRLG
jgi:hypothetical protein